MIKGKGNRTDFQILKEADLKEFTKIITSLGIEGAKAAAARDAYQDGWAAAWRACVEYMNEPDQRKPFTE